MKTLTKSMKYMFCLAALLLFALPVSAAEEEDAPDYGSLSGQVRYYYFQQTDKDKYNSSETKKESLALGGYLKYETPWLEDTLQAGLAGYVSTPFPEGRNDKDQGGTSLLTSKNEGIAVLGEAFLKGKHEQTMVTVFRQRIETPMVNGSDSRMIPNLFEAYTIDNTDVDDLNLKASWVQRIKLRDTDQFEHMSKVSGNSALGNSKQGMFLLGGDWNPSQFKNRGWFYMTPDYMRMAFLETGGTNVVSDDLSWKWRVQGLDQRSTGSNDGGSFNVAELGALGGVTWHGFGFELGGTVVDNTSDVINKYGVYPFFNNMMQFANNRAGEQALYAGLTYDFDRVDWKGFTSSFKTSFGRTPDSGRNESPDRNEYNLNFNYNFDGKLEGFSILNRWSIQESKEDKDGFQVRFRLQYNFKTL